MTHAEKMIALWTEAYNFTLVHPKHSTITYDGKQRVVLREAYVLVQDVYVDLLNVSHPVRISEVS